VVLLGPPAGRTLAAQDMKTHEPRAVNLHLLQSTLLTCLYFLLCCDCQAGSSALVVPRVSAPAARGSAERIRIRPTKNCVESKEESDEEEAPEEDGHPDMIVQRARSRKCRDKKNPLYTYLVRYTDGVHTFSALYCSSYCGSFISCLFSCDRTSVGRQRTTMCGTAMTSKRY
jgi:hypothetical protein